MAVRDSYLFPTLEAGSSRVFNVWFRTADLTRCVEQGKDDTKPDFLFHTRELNRVIIVKEARPYREGFRYKFDNPIGTKLYFPYNFENIYEGGQSAFIDDPQIESILADHAGLILSNGSKEAAQDWAILKMLDEIPSLDPFLVKDKLEIEGVVANEFYFDISESECKAIKKHVSKEFRPIIKFAFPDSDKVDNRRSNVLVNKLWNTKDIDSLLPIVDAFNLPVDEASGIFSAWKGIMYYDYEFNRNISRWRECFKWLQNDATPTDFVDKNRKDLLVSIREIVRENYKVNWEELINLISSYQASYNTLFVKKKDPAPFVDFMANAVKTYWILGSRMSVINHCVAVWDSLTSGTFMRRLKYDPLYNLLDLKREMFEQSQQMA